MIPTVLARFQQNGGGSPDMEIFTVSFFGHRKVSQFSLVEERLKVSFNVCWKRKNMWNFLLAEAENSISLRPLPCGEQSERCGMITVPSSWFCRISQQNTGTTRIASTITMTKSKSVKAPPRHILRLPCRFVTRQWLTDPTWSSAALSMIAAEPIRRCSMPESSKSGSSILQIYLPNK